MAAKALSGKYDAAVAAEASSPTEAITQLREIALGSHPNDLESIKVGSHRTGDDYKIVCVRFHMRGVCRPVPHVACEARQCRHEQPCIGAMLARAMLAQ